MAGPRFLNTQALDAREPVHAHGGVVEHRSALRFRKRFRQLLKVIPEHGVRGRSLVRRKVALEHAAVEAEHLDRVDELADVPWQQVGRMWERRLRPQQFRCAFEGGR